MQKKNLISLLSVLVVLVLIFALGLWQYNILFVNGLQSKDGQSHALYVYPNTDADSLKTQIEQHFTFRSDASWRLHMRLMRFARPKEGCYVLSAQEGTLYVLRRLRAGFQTPVKVTFHNIRTPQQLALRLSSQLLLDSASLISRLQSDTFMAQYGLSSQTAVALFLPDTYELFWTISPDRLFQRMARAYASFWSEERLAEAHRLGLAPVEVSVLASIVEEETNQATEYPIVAGLYLNRLRKGMLLQADPTVKFALQDFTLRRILYKHLQTDSPYNTYRYKGLPPGPIRIPRASTIDAVLHLTDTRYLYMCASAELNGTHHFSTTYAEHVRYAKMYQKALNQRGIR